MSKYKIQVPAKTLTKRYVGVKPEDSYVVGQNQASEGDMFVPYYDYLITSHNKNEVILPLVEIIQDLKEAINNGNANEFDNIMKKPFIYPDILSARSAHHSTETDSVEEFFDIHLARPLVETLFFDYPEKFLELLDLIIKKNDKKIATLFVTAIQQADINSKGLLAWNNDIYRGVNSQLDKLQEYGIKLEHENSTKGPTATTLVNSLSKILKTFNSNYSKSQATPSVKQLEVIKFKLEFNNKLHSEDNKFWHHRGWKRCAANILTILFTLGIANGLNKIVTGNWLFFDKTTTEEKVRLVQNSLQVSQEIPVSRGPSA